MQSDFRSGHSIMTNNMKVNNDVKEALDNKATCMSLILDLTKAFDTVDHPLFICTWFSAGIGYKSTLWFHNYLIVYR